MYTVSRKEPVFPVWDAFPFELHKENSGESDCIRVELRKMLMTEGLLTHANCVIIGIFNFFNIAQYNVVFFLNYFVMC